MNESDLEQELRKLVPVRPGDRLFQAIENELGTMASVVVAAPRVLERRVDHQLQEEAGWHWVWSFLRGLSWAGVGAAAAVAIMMSHVNQRTTLASSTEQTVNVSAAAEDAAPVQREEMVNEFVSAADEGLVIDEEAGEAQRRVRFSFIERHFWTNPETGAVIEFEVPRDDVLTMPIAMQ